MQSRILEQFLAARMSRTASSLDQIGRALRNADMLPSGARGLGAPHLETKHVANFLIAAALCRTVSEAPQIVKQYGALVARVGHPVEERHLGIPTGKMLRDPLHILGKPGQLITFKTALVAALEGRCNPDSSVGKIMFQRFPQFRSLAGMALARCDFGEFIPRNRIDWEKDQNSLLWFSVESDVAIEEVTFGAELTSSLRALMGNS
jgi:hypothetical protein